MRIEIRGLTFECIIGILDFEREHPQRVVINAVIDYDYIPGSFLDYAAIADTLKATMQHEAFKLIEEALTALSALLKTRFPSIQKLHLTIQKPDILPDCSVSVSHTSNF